MEGKIYQITIEVEVEDTELSDLTVRAALQSTFEKPEIEDAIRILLQENHEICIEGILIKTIRRKRDDY